MFGHCSPRPQYSTIQAISLLVCFKFASRVFIEPFGVFHRVGFAIGWTPGRFTVLCTVIGLVRENHDGKLFLVHAKPVFVFVFVSFFAIDVVFTVRSYNCIPSSLKLRNHALVNILQGKCCRWVRNYRKVVVAAPSSVIIYTNIRSTQRWQLSGVTI